VGLKKPTICLSPLGFLARLAHPEALFKPGQEGTISLIRKGPRVSFQIPKAFHCGARGKQKEVVPHREENMAGGFLKKTF